MYCDHELLELYLDGELDEDAAGALCSHLTSCPACRRELGRLRLLWLELGNPADVPLPPELPYLRQQAANSAPPASEPGLTFWESQRLAWTSARLAAGYLAENQLLNGLARGAGSGLRASLRGLGRLGLRAVTKGLTRR